MIFQHAQCHTMSHNYVPEGIVCRKVMEIDLHIRQDLVTYVTVFMWLSKIVIHVVEDHGTWSTKFLNCIKGPCAYSYLEESTLATWQCSIVRMTSPFIEYNDQSLLCYCTVNVSYVWFFTIRNMLLIEKNLLPTPEIK